MARRQPLAVQAQGQIAAPAFGQLAVLVPQDQVEGRGRLERLQGLVGLAPRRFVGDELGAGAARGDGLGRQGQAHRLGARQQWLGLGAGAAVTVQLQAHAPAAHSLATYHQLLASDALLAAGELDAAEQLMREAEATLLPAQVTEIWHLALQRAWLALWRGDAPQLRTQAQAAIAAAQAIGSPICEAFGWMALGEAELLAGRLDGLRALLPGLAAQATRADSRLVDALHALLRGCAFGDSADWQQVRALLRELPHPPLFTRGMLEALQ